jgi:hypothetical protein
MFRQASDGDIRRNRRQQITFEEIKTGKSSDSDTVATPNLYLGLVVIFTWQQYRPIHTVK